MIVLGTRPEAIKLIPVYLACKNYPNLETILVSTGQHREMLDQIFGFFGTRPDIDLSVMTKNQTLSSLTSTLFTRLDEIATKMQPDCIVVQGDTTTAMVASMLGFYHQTQVAHVEAGLRTGNKFSPFPEEVNRRIIGITADIHFTPTGSATKALELEGVNNIFQVGNTVVDSLLLCYEKVNESISKYINKFSHFLQDQKKMVLITGHRRESFGRGFESICLALSTLAQKYSELQFVYPVHLNPNVRTVVYEKLKKNNNIFLIDPLPYDELVYIMSKSCIILSDSGGIQEEAPSLNVPLIVLRDTTERPEGIEAGCSVLAGTDHINIINAFESIYGSKDLYDKMSNVENPYGDGKSSERIAKILDN